MSDTIDKSTYNHEAFVSKFMQYCEWLEPAKKSGNLAEYRGRTEAIILWLEQQKKTAPADKNAWFDSAIAQITASMASMPKPAQIPDLPDAATLGAQNLDEIMRKEGEAAVDLVESWIPQFPSRFAGDITYCLAASKGLRVHGTIHEYHQMFANYFRCLGIATALKNEAGFYLAAQDLEKWGKQTGLNQGFDRAELERRISDILNGGEDSTPPPKSGGFGFFGVFRLSKKLKELTKKS